MRRNFHGIALYERKHIGGDPQICISVPLVKTQVKYRELKK